MADSLVTTAFDAGTGVARLTFNRPEALNAINIPLAEALLAAVRDIHGLSGVRCIVLTGAGRAFMAGGDVSSMAGTSEQAGAAIGAILDAVNPAVLLLRGMDAPVIAAVRGVAAGAGLSLTLMADLVIADEEAKFLVAYNGIGAVPDCGGSWALAHKLGAGRAAELMLLGRTLGADEARDWGIVNEVVPDSEFDNRLNRMIEKVAQGPTRAYGAFRKLIDQANGGRLADHLEAERAAFLEMTRTEDFAEGVSAFLAKRPSEFRGR
ncbi:enoyl-CoA hydratase/isomerase family protein [Marinobacter salsuginis]|uniref:Enoyl-CoA hydratase n=1 Tax=Marinobacter salsuginis TaxID=418719 RepID=A0A5M3PPC7_9GAMM|nr:enoyl-CoA hydratase-related protein [Marinobacter salsuginis]GBO84754.1 enoyl-CoA hydratase [Marinobacter salsuginis]|tara:strand:+ start:815 stop:1609 length:795 start_codon:yes stop_codon:yes gene_type:complete